MLKRTTISEDDGMKVDEDSQSQVHDDRPKAPMSRAIETKRRILNNYVSRVLYIIHL